VPALALAVFLIFVGRPLAVWLCLWPFGFTAREKLFVSWVGLRGAVSIFLAAVPMLSGVANAEVYFNVAFFIVLVSLLVQGWTLTWTAKRLHVALDQPAPEARRVEIDLPGQLELEMVGYPIVADSPIRTRKSLPSWVRPVFIVRDNAILAPEQAGRLQAGDYGYFLANPNRVRRLDRWFAPHDGEEPRTAGVFLFKGEVPLAEIAILYGLPMPDDLKALTVAEAFAERFESRLETGDVLHLGPATLIATDTDGDLVLTAALEFDEEDDLTSAAPRSMGSDVRLGGPSLLRLSDRRSRHM
jgi:cell volume regulation protein A